MSGNQSRATDSRNSSRSLLSREEHYKRMNDELTAKTTSLVQEVDAVLKAQENILSKPSLLDRINTDDYLREYDNEDDFSGSRPSSAAKAPYQVNQEVSARQPPKGITSSSATASTERLNASQHAKAKQSIPKSVGGRKKSSAAASSSAVDDVAVVDKTNNFSLQKTISAIEQRLDTAQSDGAGYDEDDDIMPAVANDMGAEAQIRFLKAKLRVMQEEMDRLSVELTSKEEALGQVQSKLKDVDEEKNRLQRTNAAQHTQLDKYKKMAEDNKSRADSLDVQLAGLKKELDSLSRNQKQQSNNQSATEVRLNQAREDVQKYKSLLQKAQADAKENLDQEKAKIEHLVAENKRLEKQKSELMNGFKKQLKLIDVLKRQKMHIEAARMLNFTEEEFVKALEWGN